MVGKMDVPTTLIEARGCGRRHRCRRRTSLPLVLAGAALLALACDSGNPVEPAPVQPPGPNETFQITLTAVPERLQAGSAEPATVTVTVRRRDDGLAPPDGTEVAVNTDRGSLGVDDPAETLAILELAGGRAQVSFFPGAEVGEATLVAQVSTSLGSLTVPIVEALPSSFFLTGVSPATGGPDGGESVTITGAGFEEPLRVAFGGVVATVTAVSAGSIAVLTPPSAIPLVPGQSIAVDVSVTNTLTDPEPPTDTLPGAYTYFRDAPPGFFLVEVRPNRGDPAGGTPVSIFGGGFRPPVTVDFGGSTATDPVVVSDGEIRVTTPESPMPVGTGESLPVNVTVTNALGSETSTVQVLPGGFVYFRDAPEQIVVTGLAPASGDSLGGTRVTLTGRGFPAEAAVELAGLRQLDETTVSSTEIEFTTAGVDLGECPPGAVLPQVGVTVTDLASGNQGSAPLTFTYRLPTPRVDRISPTSGGQSGGTSVTLEGAGFEAPLRVVFARGGSELAAQVQSVASDRVRVLSPRVPDDLFEEVDCVVDTTPPQAGKRYVAVTADVRVENLAAGCADVLPNAYTYNPDDTTCRPVQPPSE